MSRVPLEKGSIVISKNNRFTIESVVGDGATSIVYNACYFDSIDRKHNIRLKECYPYSVNNITRNNNELLWPSKAEQDLWLTQFQDSYDKLLKGQSSNFYAHVFDAFESNGTMYVVMDANDGMTFDKTSFKSLEEILKTLKLLAHVVDGYHKEGYLHLDIKPSNFLVYPRPSEHIVLFDVDSVTQIQDLKSGRVSAISYSEQWAAPEQLQGRIDKFCPATDIYSIGSILFKCVMGRNVQNHDMGLFSEWQFEGQLFEKVNPKIKRLLSNIFHKTLSANVSRRYQSAEELIVDLEESILILAKGSPYILSDCPLPTKNFVGRISEIDRISDLFLNGTRAVFLRGVGGIGKSELAKQYAYINRNNYDAIVFLRYGDSLRSLVDNIAIANLSFENKEEHSTVLKTILNDHKVLIIVDNFDVPVDSDDFLTEFLKFNANIIFTTRTDFSKCLVEIAEQIDVKELFNKELLTLFANESKSNYIGDAKQEESVHELIRKAHKHTLLISILARQLASSGWTPTELLNKFDVGLKTFEHTEKVVVLKDDKIHNKNMLDILRATFRVVELSHMQKDVLLNFYLLRGFVLNKEQYRKYLLDTPNKAEYIDTINQLQQLGWIQQRYAKQGDVDPELELHPLVCEMIGLEIKPDISKSAMLLDYAENYLPFKEMQSLSFDEESFEYLSTLEQDKIRIRNDWLTRLALFLDINNPNNSRWIVDVIYRLTQGNLHAIDTRLLDLKHLDCKLTDIFELTTIEDKIEQFKLLSILEILCLKTLRSRHKKFRRSAEAKKYFFMMNDIVQKTADTEKNDLVRIMCKPVMQLVNRWSGLLYKRGHFRTIYNETKKYESICLDMLPLDRMHEAWDYDYIHYKSIFASIQEAEAEAKRIEEEAKRIEEEGLDSDCEGDISELLTFKKFQECHDVASFIDELSVIYQDSDQLIFVLRNVIHQECEPIVNPWIGCYNTSAVSAISRDKVLLVLDRLEELCLESEGNILDTLELTDVCHAVLYALDEKTKPKAEEYLNKLMEGFKIEHNCKHWRHYKLFTNIDNLPTLATSLGMNGHLLGCIQALMSCDLYDVAFRPLSEIYNLFEKYVQSQKESSPEDMYCWIKILRECAEEASVRAKDPNEDAYYREIAEKLTQKENALTEADYKINDLYNPFNK